MTRAVLFVCPHGAGMSRIAAAWFNTTAPTGWHATSIGTDVQTDLGTNVPRLLAGTAAECQLAHQPARSIAPVPARERVVAAGAEHWEFEQRELTEGMGDEIRSRVSGLIAELCSQTIGV